jgi:hypothetical protein
MEYGVENKIWDGVITLKVVEVETQPKISTTIDALCESHKCGAGEKTLEFKMSFLGWWIGKII